MSKAISLALFLLLCQAVLVNAQRKSDREMSELTGSVRSVKEETASVEVIKGKPVEQKREFSSLETFDLDGKQLSYAFGLSDGKDEEHKTYDEKGRLIEVTRKKVPNLYLLPKKVLHYNEKDQLTEEVGYDDDGTMLGKYAYTYDSFGNQIEERSEPATASKLWYNDYLVRKKYDEYNRLIGEARYSKAGDEWLPANFGYGYHKQEFLYDSAGRRIAEINFDTNDRIFNTTLTGFNEQGLETESSTFNADGTVKERTKYSYDKFDSHGSWTKQTEYEWTTVDGKASFQPTEITYRDIQYFSDNEIKARKPRQAETAETPNVLQNTDPEEYAVYDEMMADWMGADGPSKIVINRFTADRSFSDDAGETPDGVSKETADDFAAKNKRRTYALLPNLFPRPVKIVLINESETTSIFSDTHNGWKNFYAKYPKSQGITTFSRVGFNYDKTEAVVYFGTQSDWLAGAGYIAILHKETSGWKVASSRMLWISMNNGLRQNDEAQIARLNFE